MNIDELSANGYAVVSAIVPSALVSKLRLEVEEHLKGRKQAGIRGIVNKSLEIKALADSPTVCERVRSVIGNEARLVRSIVFNKSPEKNWLVAWHQDLSIAVEARAELCGFTAWSEKASVCHVQPPIDVLRKMITVRIHLDDTNSENGALIVAPGTHKLGRIPADKVSYIAAQYTVHTCSVRAGDALFFHPLLIHSSKKAVAPRARRVIHLEYSSAQLPEPLRWSDAA